MQNIFDGEKHSCSKCRQKFLDMGDHECPTCKHPLPNDLIARHEELHRAAARKKQSHTSYLIQQDAVKRKIKHLYHFTKTDNIPSILAHGILAENFLKQEKIKHKITDRQRYDKETSSISVSVSWPNYKYFYKIREEEKQFSWVVLELDPDILWDLPCKFFFTNASNKIVQERELSGSGFEHYHSMFLSREGRYKTEASQKLEPCKDLKYPTCPQAEVMVKGHIPAGFINRILVQTKEEKQRMSEVSNLCSGPPVHVCPGIFESRQDFERWKDVKIYG